MRGRRGRRTPTANAFGNPPEAGTMRTHAAFSGTGTAVLRERAQVQLSLVSTALSTRVLSLDVPPSVRLCRSSHGGGLKRGASV